MMYDPAYFSRLCYEAEVNKVQKTGGINTMGEKRLHQVLKRYYESDETRHEQPVGRFIADVLRDEEIIEVQTGSFFPLKAKDCLLSASNQLPYYHCPSHSPKKVGKLD